MVSGVQYQLICACFYVSLLSISLSSVSLATYLFQCISYIPICLSLSSLPPSLSIISLSLNPRPPACISFRLPLSLALPVVIDALSLATLSVHLHWHDVLFCGHSSLPLISCFWVRYLLPLTDQFLLRAICFSISTVPHYLIMGSRQNISIILSKSQNNST